jgi:WD40 repeat protein
MVSLLATCSADTTIKIWQIENNYTASFKKQLVGHQRWVWDAAFSADSAYLVSGMFVWTKLNTHSKFLYQRLLIM